MKQVAALLAIGLTLAQTAQAVTLEGKAYYWYMTPEGDVAVGSGGLAGTEVDLEDDLGYDETEGIVGARVLVGGDVHQLGADFFTLDLSAKSTIDRTINFSDLTFRVQDNIQSSLEATLVRGYYRLNVGSETVSGGLLLGGQYIGIDAEASSQTVGSASAEAEAGAPIVGAHLTLHPLPLFLIEGSLIGTSLDFGSIEATYYDAEISGSLVIPPGLLLGGGYRYIDIDGEYDDEDIEVDLQFSGPILFAGFHW